MELFFDFLPKYQQEIIKKLADVFQISTDYVVSGLFAAVAASQGDRYQIIDPKGYRNATALWLCQVGISGYGKSNCAEWLVSPLVERDEQRHYHHKEESAKWAKQDPLKRGEEPIEQKLVLNDYTPEVFFKTMEEAGENGILLYRDEFAGWLKDIGRYGKSGEVEQYLSAWSHKFGRTTRLVRSDNFSKRPCFSIFGGIQPDILREQLGKSDLLTNGFVSRFLFVCADDQLPLKYYEESIPDSLNVAYHNLIGRLVETPHHEIRFNEEARESFIRYWEDLQRRKASEGKMISQLLAKLQIYVEKWAGIIELLIRDGQLIDEITGDSMNFAIAHMKAFEGWAIKVYNEICPAFMQKSMQKPMLSKQETLEQLLRNYPNMNKAQVAEGLGINRSALSRTTVKATPPERNTQQPLNIGVNGCYTDSCVPS